MDTPATTSKKVLVDRDRINHAPRKEIADATVRLFDRIQHLPTEVRVLALCAAFNLMIRAARLEPADVFAATNNVIAEDTTSTGLEPRFGAMLYHLEQDILSKAV